MKMVAIFSLLIKHRNSRKDAIFPIFYDESTNHSQLRQKKVTLTFSQFISAFNKKSRFNLKDVYTF